MPDHLWEDGRPMNEPESIAHDLAFHLLPHLHQLTRAEESEVWVQVFGALSALMVLRLGVPETEARIEAALLAVRSG